MLKQYVTTLAEYAKYWQFSPFECSRPDWNPTLVHYLVNLSEAEIEELAADSRLSFACFSPWFPKLLVLPDIADEVADAAPPSYDIPFWLTNGIGGRKLAQIEALLAQLPTQPQRLMEWCAGKGHLGRLLSFTHQHSVCSVEWQLALCEAGQQLAQQHQLPQQFIQADVLQHGLDEQWAQVDGAVALHACGDLHLQLLRSGAEHQVQNLYVAPCCYHLIQADTYAGLSAYGQQLLRRHFMYVGRPLTRADLKLAVQEQVTAGARVARLRQQEVQWRLAYQQLYQIVSGQLHYRPLPSVSKHWFSGEFLDFAKWAAQQHGIELPAEVDVPYLLASGEAERIRVARMDLVRHLFRRPLEAMLVLDRAQYLQKQGYQVQIKEFCDYNLTPRNFLISAQQTKVK